MFFPSERGTISLYRSRLTDSIPALEEVIFLWQTSIYPRFSPHNLAAGLAAELAISH